MDAVLEDRTITHVIVNNKNGLAAYKAKCFIDCTGDADLIKLVGASYQSGNHNRVNQPVSLRFDMAGIDFERFHAYMRSLGNDQYKYFAMNTPGMKDIIRKAYENGVLTVTLNNLCTEAEKEIERVLTKKKPAHVSARIVHGKMQAYNSFEEPERVTEEDFTDFRLTDRGLTFTIPACSVLMFRVEMEG